ncbi:uncharacterized protein LOC126614285 [Malus sylvestris]|uniref:uncharacterized protein LOC126614285 n=1 Tax=Malus sylvestris TaxID=3752 RepID=UPI0021AD413E|nr:uncharacterized protein LOC126614285 [Malus sylvestris]
MVPVLTRRGEGAARFKQGLGFSSANFDSKNASERGSPLLYSTSSSLLTEERENRQPAGVSERENKHSRKQSRSRERHSRRRSRSKERYRERDRDRDRDMDRDRERRRSRSESDSDGGSRRRWSSIHWGRAERESEMRG